MIKDPIVAFVTPIFYFKFLKHFIDIPFIKIVLCISF